MIYIFFLYCLRANYMYIFSESSSALETNSNAIECPTCNRPFVNVNDYMHKKNKYTKSYKCDVCLSFFSSKSSLTMHTRTHTGEKPFACATCDKKFATKSALRNYKVTHSEERRFKCEVCHKENEERPGQAHGVPWQPEALVREVQQKVLHFKRTEVARKKKLLLA